MAGSCHRTRLPFNHSLRKKKINGHLLQKTGTAFERSKKQSTVGQQRTRKQPYKRCWFSPNIWICFGPTGTSHRQKISQKVKTIVKTMQTQKLNILSVKKIHLRKNRTAQNPHYRQIKQMQQDLDSGSVCKVSETEPAVVQLIKLFAPCWRCGLLKHTSIAATETQTRKNCVRESII